MKLRNLYVKQVQSTLVFCVCMLWPFRVAFSLDEPVESFAPAPAAASVSAGYGDSDATHITYDQRQTGKYNIHLSIKDVAIIEMDQNEIEDMNYSEEDYYYDEGHMTVKPIYLSPISALNKPNQTISSTAATTTITHTKPYQEQVASTNPTTSTILVNQTSYSPNLLANIAATHTANSDHIKINVTSTSPATTTKRTQNVVILDTQSATHSSPTSTHKPATSTTIRQVESYARSKNTPTPSAIQEPLMHSKSHSNEPRIPPRSYFRFIDATNANKDDANKNQLPSDHENDSKIFKFKVRRAHRGHGSHGLGSDGVVPYPSPVSGRRTCRANQFRDINGNCRAKRSSSLLKKLLNMLITLPFANERIIGDRDDE